MEPQQREDFERLYRVHRNEIFRYLLRELGNPADADDATQEAFLSAFGAIERNGPPAHPRPWLYAIAENLRRRWYRRRRTRGTEPLERAGARSMPEPDVAASEVTHALEQLPARQAQVLVGRDVAGLSYAELAGRLGLTENAVQMLLFRARKRFRAAIEAQGRGALVWVSLARPAALFSDGVTAPVLRAAALAGVAAAGFAAASPGSAGPHSPAARVVRGDPAPAAAVRSARVLPVVVGPRAAAARSGPHAADAPAAPGPEETSSVGVRAAAGDPPVATTTAGSTALSQVSSTDVVASLAPPSATAPVSVPLPPIPVPSVPAVTTVLPVADRPLGT